MYHWPEQNTNDTKQNNKDMTSCLFAEMSSKLIKLKTVEYKCRECKFNANKHYKDCVASWLEKLKLTLYIVLFCVVRSFRCSCRLLLHKH